MIFVTHIVCAVVFAGIGYLIGRSRWRIKTLDGELHIFGPSECYAVYKQSLATISKKEFVCLEVVPSKES